PGTGLGGLLGRASGAPRGIARETPRGLRGLAGGNARPEEGFLPGPAPGLVSATPSAVGRSVPLLRGTALPLWGALLVWRISTRLLPPLCAGSWILHPDALLRVLHRAVRKASGPTG